MIKIIVGVRRCGKSIILKQIIWEIKKKTNNVIYLNFEDDNVISNIYNSEKLLEYVEKNRKDGKCYIFLDEIYEVSNWNRTVKTLRLHNNSVFITGSNSKILSKEYTDVFSGRYSGGYMNLCYYNSSGWSQVVGSPMSIRPILTLKSDITINVGSETKDDSYVLS